MQDSLLPLNGLTTVLERIDIQSRMEASAYLLWSGQLF